MKKIISRLLSPIIGIYLGISNILLGRDLINYIVSIIGDLLSLFFYEFFYEDKDVKKQKRNDTM